MSECIDKKYEVMLHAYVLGLLSEDDRLEYEMHLLNCRHCSQRAYQALQVSQMLLLDPDIRDHIQRYTSEESDLLKKAPAGKFDIKSICKPKVIPGLIIFVSILIVLILKPWGIEIHPTNEASAYESQLAIMPFEYAEELADSLLLSEILTSLLITDLAESQYVRVVSDQRIKDILSLFDLENNRFINKNLALKVAKESKSKWLLMAKIIRTEPVITLSFKLVDAESNEILYINDISGKPDETIFALIDNLTYAIKDALSHQKPESRDFDRPISSVTTKSETAYRNYIEGVNSYNKCFWSESTNSFRKAIEHDSALAMAHYYLAQLHTDTLRDYYTNKAVHYSENASGKERYFIHSMSAEYRGLRDSSILILQELLRHHPYEKRAYFLLGVMHTYEGAYEKARNCLNQAIELDPFYKAAFNQLIYVYDGMDDFRNTILAIDKYMDLAPNEPNPYDTQGEIYARNGMIDKAITSFQTALKLKPDFYPSLINLGKMYIYNGEYDKANSCFTQITELNNYTHRAQGRLYLAIVPLYQGNFNLALELLDAGIKADGQDQAGNLSVFKYALKSQIYLQMNQLKEATNSYAMCFLRDPKSSPIGWDWILGNHIYTLVQTGKVKLAEMYAINWKKDLDKNSKKYPANYWLGRGYIEKAKGNLRKATDHFDEAVKLSDNFEANYMLAQMYLETDQLGKAIPLLEKLALTYGNQRLFHSIWSVKLHYYLGLAYEKSNWNTEAITQYENFLRLWENADNDIAEIDIARKRISKLKASN